MLVAIGFEPGPLWWLAVTLTTRLGYGSNWKGVKLTIQNDIYEHILDIETHYYNINLIRNYRLEIP